MKINTRNKPCLSSLFLVWRMQHCTFFSWFLGRILCWLLGGFLSWFLGRPLSWFLGGFLSWLLGGFLSWFLGRPLSWFLGSFFITLKAPRHVGYCLIKATTSVVLALFPPYPIIATVYSFVRDNSIAFVICKRKEQLSCSKRQFRT